MPSHVSHRFQARRAQTAPTPADTGSDSAPGRDIVVTARNQDFRPGSLKNEIVKTEVVSEAAIRRLNAQNVNQAVDKSLYNYQDGTASPGNIVGYDSGRGGFSEIIFAKRFSAIGTLEGQLGDDWIWRAAARLREHRKHGKPPLAGRYGLNVDRP